MVLIRTWVREQDSDGDHNWDFCSEAGVLIGSGFHNLGCNVAFEGELA